MPRPPRLVRQQPLSERIKAKLNLFDFLLWLSEEIETRDWDSRRTGIQLGILTNFTFLLARANTGRSFATDDVFSDSRSASWTSFFVHPLVWILTAVSILNAFHTVTRSRHYRLFEANVERKPSTPSAHRVRIDSSPVSSTPLRLLSEVVGAETAESRAHPDKTRDVWELALWDPLPLAMQFLCLFSPGHVLIYMIFLPLRSMDPRPSVTVFQCILLQVMLSVQLLWLHSLHSQQAKDAALIQKEVLHEYDTKYVHPRLHPVVREASTQVSMGESGPEQEIVEVGWPATLIRRGFQTHPNNNYAKHVDPDYHSAQNQTRKAIGPNPFTPSAKARYSDPFTASTQISRSPAPRQSLPSSSISSSATGISAAGGVSLPASATTNFGGSLGVYSHANSPLKKATSMGEVGSPGISSPRNSREMAALEQRSAAERLIRQSSPLKENRRPKSHLSQPPPANPFANPRQNRYSQERFPSLWS